MDSGDNVLVGGNTEGDLGGANSGDDDIWFAKYQPPPDPSPAPSYAPAPLPMPLPTASPTFVADDGPDDGFLDVIGDSAFDYWSVTKDLVKNLWSAIF